MDIAAVAVGIDSIEVEAFVPKLTNVRALRHGSQYVSFTRFNG